MALNGLESFYKAQKELAGERTDCYTRSLDDLREALVREGVRLYPAKRLAGTIDTFEIGSLFGFRVYVDETLPPNEIEMRNHFGRVVRRFRL